MMTREEKIARLTNQQVLSVVDSLAGEFAASDAPERQEDQVQALQTLFQQYEGAVEVSWITAESDEGVAADAARQLLGMMARVPEVQASLDEWLDRPPTQETAAIPLILAAPIVITGCITFLYVVGHVHFERRRDGTWTFAYDPTKKSPMDENMKGIIQNLTDIMRLFNPRG